MSRFEQRVRRRLQSSEEFRDGFQEGAAEFNLAQALDRARVERNLTKAELARRMGRERAFVSRKLTHPENIELETLTLMLRSLGKRADIVIRDARRGDATLSVRAGTAVRKGERVVAATVKR